ncbi:unnamed protein product [Gemmata massiliana]|uniref:Uncharacterized protein n=1 Tax=Gemmata massiliana TaxID=1210884 RepID=A0A6P2CXF0_9BACT|nr:hypothetical protein [Gemmata massiliana]VTR93573.1 unnamed protein product [Gemmata massiliana]
MIDGVTDGPEPVAPALIHGIACPRCKGTKWKVWMTRTMVSRMVRVRDCSSCFLRVRTREVIESVVGEAPRSTIVH